MTVGSILMAIGIYFFKLPNNFVTGGVAGVGVLLTSIGSAIIFYAGGSSGGTDIVALILKNYTKMNIGKALLVTDSAVAASSFFTFGITVGLFSLAGLFAKAFIVDGIIESLNVYKYFIVITKNKAKIADFIMKELHHGVTTHEVVGEYTGNVQYMIHTVCKRIEASKLMKQIKNIDEHSFVIVATGNEIIGRGFREV